MNVDLGGSDLILARKRPPNCVVKWKKRELLFILFILLIFLSVSTVPNRLQRVIAQKRKGKKIKKIHHPHLKFVFKEEKCDFP